MGDTLFGGELRVWAVASRAAIVASPVVLAVLLHAQGLSWPRAALGAVLFACLPIHRTNWLAACNRRDAVHDQPQGGGLMPDTPFVGFDEKYGEKFDAVFGEQRPVFCEKCGMRTSWCECDGQDGSDPR